LTDKKSSLNKVLVITYYWPPGGGAGVQRILKFVKYFPAFGIKPYVVTVREDKASYPDTDESLLNDVPKEAKIYRTDTFEPFGIYSKLLGKKSIPTGFSNESHPGAFQKFSRFVRGNFFIPDARRGWIKFAFDEACKIIEKENIKTVITTSPPHSAQLVGLKLKKKYGFINWVADLRDPWTDIYYYNEFNHTSIAGRLDLKYERLVLENSDVITTVSRSLKDLFAKKSAKVDHGKIYVIPNGFDPDDFQYISENPADEFIITYTGTIADSYDPAVFFEALKKTIQKFPEVKFKLRFIGNPASSLIENIKKISLSDCLDLVATVTHERSVQYLLQSTILFLAIPCVKNDKGILTGKIFEYLAARKPIVCIGPSDGDAAVIIEECKAGMTFERDQENQITVYLEQLVNEWKMNRDLDIKNDNFKKYSRYSQAKELSELLVNFKK